MVNIKPSRVGGLRELCETYDYCAEHGIGAYGGGQWELGVGRGQIQVLASLFHPDTPNDTAPRPTTKPSRRRPASPMECPIGAGALNCGLSRKAYGAGSGLPLRQYVAGTRPSKET